jgi:hypothetical protein
MDFQQPMLAKWHDVGAVRQSPLYTPPFVIHYLLAIDGRYSG